MCSPTWFDERPASSIARLKPSSVSRVTAVATVSPFDGK
jgi:hypothetical protein